MTRALRPAARILSAGAASAAILMAPPSFAAPGGPLGTLPLGRYVCELPGDALGPAGVRQPQLDFEVTNASSYRTARGGGIYLLTGVRLTFTSGPLRGLRYHRLNEGFLRRSQADGTDGELRCVRMNGTNYIGD